MQARGVARHGFYGRPQKDSGRDGDHDRLACGVVADPQVAGRVTRTAARVGARLGTVHATLPLRGRVHGIE